MNLISDYSTRTHQVWTLTGNTLESTFTSTQGRTWWEKITLNVQNYEEVENTQNDYTDKYLTVEGLMTTIITRVLPIQTALTHSASLVGAYPKG